MPMAWFWDDVRSLDHALSVGVLEKTFNAGCMMTHDLEQFGLLVPWDRDRMHREEICAFPVAKVVLESQDLLTRTLRAIVDDVLAGLTEGSGSKKWTEAVKDDFRVLHKTDEVSRVEHSIPELPYGPPQRFQITELSDLISQRCEIHMDHLKDLQTDPTYIQSVIHEMLGARQVLELRNVSDRDQERFWVTSSKSIWLYDYLRFVDWTNILWYVRNVPSGVSNHDPEQSPRSCSSWDRGQDLPSEYADHLVELSQSIRCRLGYWISPLEEQCLQHFSGITTSPFSPANVPLFQDGAGSNAFRRSLFAKDRLAWALLELYVPLGSDEREEIDTAVVLGVLAEELSMPTERSRLDEKALLLINDVFALYLVWRAVMSHSPAFPRRKGVFKLNAVDPMFNGELKITQGLYPAVDALWSTAEEGNPQKRCRELGRDLRALYYARWPKGRPSEAWIQKASEARTTLAAFWDRWRILLRAAYDSFEPGLYDDSRLVQIVGVLKYDLQPEYRRLVREEELAVRSHIAGRTLKQRSAAPPVHHARPRKSIPHSSTSEPADKFQPLQRKQKQKTVGTPSPQPEVEPAVELQQEGQPPSPESPHRPRILITKKSFEVLERMFPAESGNLKEGTIRFRDVEGVLTEAGLSVEQGQGSAVIFKQEGDDSKRSSRISIHRPHRQGDVVDANILRRIGYRLRDRLGWKLKHFDVKKAR